MPPDRSVRPAASLRFRMPVALLTGVGREGQVGEAFGRRRSADGFELILVDRTAAHVQERATALADSGKKVSAHACDLSDPDAVTALFRDIGRVYPSGLNALVHMAGGFAATGSIADTDVTAWDQQLTINLRTAFLTARGVLPLLRQQRGAIVFFSSESALDGAKVAHVAAYAVAKSSVLVLSRAISQEEHSAGVRSNVVAPAAIRTATNIASMGRATAFVEREDVAATVAYLCSPQAAAITGQVLRLGAR
jgi:Dehydrogenases with different specificities (related to short-chain alcohol dehydrogenases)